MDNITPERNVAYSKDLFEFLKKELGTPGDGIHVGISLSLVRHGVVPTPLLELSMTLGGSIWGEP